MARRAFLTDLLHVVAAALIDAEGRVLIQQRPQGTQMAGLWEFPGGKIDLGETPEIALQRELLEELSIGVEISDLTPIAFASEALGDRHLLLLLYTCSIWQGEVKALHASAIEWLRPEELYTKDMPPADAPLIPILEKLI